MRIIVAGAGKTGLSLCQMLSDEGHNVVLIDQDAVHLERTINKVDIMGIPGNAADYDVLLEADLEDAEAFISLTPFDEINLLACMFAARSGVRLTVARVQKPEYTDHGDFIRREMGITALLNPNRLAASELARMIQFPSALGIESLVDDRFFLVEVEVPQQNALVGKNLIEFRRTFSDAIVCAIRREDSTFIPGGRTTLQADDRLYIAGTRRTLNKLYRYLATDYDTIDSVLIIGGGVITHFLLEMVASMRVQIKVIEQNPTVADSLSINYPDVQVILGDGTNQELLEEEGIRHFDCVISLTGIDEENLITSLFCIQQGVPRNITKVNRLRLIPLLKESRLQTILTPYQIVATQIIRDIRALQGTEGSSLESLYRIANGAAEAFIFRVNSDSAVLDLPIMEMEFNKNVLIGAIIRNRQMIFPTGQDRILPGDRVVIMTTQKGYDEIDDILTPAFREARRS